MAGIKIEVTPWNSFYARKDDAVIRRWMEQVGNNAEQAFRAGASRQWGGGKGSSPGEWPMRRSGNLLRTIGHEVSGDSVTVGSAGRRMTGRGFDYSSWLKKTGRKMSKEALRLGILGAKLGRWVKWVRT